MNALMDELKCGEVKDTRLAFTVYPSQARKWREFCSKNGLSMNRALTVAIERLIEEVEAVKNSTPTA